MSSTVIFVMGHPASGKTTLARKIADELAIPMFGKDVTFKEPMFDAFETTSREWSMKVGRAAFAIMKEIMEQQLKAGYSFVIESTFKYEYDNPLFTEWQEKYGFQAIQVICHTNPEVLVNRYHERIEAGERHPGHGHFDEEFNSEKAKEPIVPFDLTGEIIEMNTDTFSPEKTALVLQKVKNVVGK